MNKKLLFVWIFPYYCLNFSVFMFGFPVFSKESGKPKNRRDSKKKSVFFYCLDFPDFRLDSLQSIKNNFFDFITNVIVIVNVNKKRDWPFHIHNHICSITLVVITYILSPN
jgi:hypothetical protein